MSFIHDDFLLQSATARRLYHGVAADLPIIDFHCHLPPQEIADDRRFPDLFSIWLAGDHYKWRAMRADGVAEKFCTGDIGRMPMSGRSRRLNSHAYICIKTDP